MRPIGEGRVVLAAGSGFLGQSLARELTDRGYEVVILTRSANGVPTTGRAVLWDGKTVGDWVSAVDGAEAVVNLAGKNVNCRYTRKNLREIDESRVDSVRAIAEAVRRSARPPRVWVQAGTLAIYGDRGQKLCDETTPPGEGIPVQTAMAWEQAFQANPTPQTRRVLLRISFALGTGGGALATLTALTRRFLGGRIASGRQYISWIHLADLNRMFVWAIERDDIEGVFNATAPHPVTNATFMGELRRVLGRPWSPPVPGWAVRLGAFFLRTEPVLALTGRRGIPTRFIDKGFEFEHPELPAALENVFAD
ncbi:MAG: TIGR01777 family oxidoreductase [Pirellulales bacterium]